MGGHGGLNILPQKKWNVYNYDNRDIVEKDKKLHAQKMQKKYQYDRKNTLQHKFDVLKGQFSENDKNETIIKSQFKKDSILNHEFNRLAQQKQHVNLFEHEQKILENREVTEYKKLKEAEWLKGKDLDYSSKFLGTFNEDSKLPWYTKTKDLDKKKEFKKKQRYDMEELVDRMRQEKRSDKKLDYKGQLTSQKDNETQELKSQHLSYNQKNTVKMQFYSERERSRDRKYEFLKSRQESYKAQNQDRKCNQKLSTIDEKCQKQIKKSQKINSNIHDEKPFDFVVDPKVLINTAPKTQLSKQQQEQLQRLRQKRHKREEKQHKRANELKRKLIQNSITN